MTDDIDIRMITNFIRDYSINHGISICQTFKLLKEEFRKGKCGCPSSD